MIPNKVISSEKWQKRIEWVNKEISTPENRLILGVTALMSQPFIDAHNKSVDEDTRKVSVCRTLAKIIAGTLTGYFIRKGCIKAIDKWSKLPSSVDKAGNKIEQESREKIAGEKVKTVKIKRSNSRYGHAFSRQGCLCF